MGTGVRSCTAPSEPHGERETLPGSIDVPESASTGSCPPSWEDPEQWREAKREMERRAAARIAEARRKAKDRQLPGLDKLTAQAPASAVVATSAAARESSVGEEPADSESVDPGTKPSLLVPSWMEPQEPSPRVDPFDDAWADMLAAGDRAAKLPGGPVPAAAAGPAVPTTCVELPPAADVPKAAAVEAMPKPATSGGLPKPATSGALPKPATSGALPKPATGGPAASPAGVVEPAVDSPAATPPPSAQLEGAEHEPDPEVARPSRWDEAVAHAQADAAAEEDDGEEDGAEAQVESPPAESQPSGAACHAWDAVLRKVAPAGEGSSRADAADEPGRHSQGQDPIHRAAVQFDEGFHCLRNGDAEGALSSWRQALELDPGNRKYQTNLRKLETKLSERGDLGADPAASRRRASADR